MWDPKYTYQYYQIGNMMSNVAEWYRFPTIDKTKPKSLGTARLLPAKKAISSEHRITMKFNMKYFSKEIMISLISLDLNRFQCLESNYCSRALSWNSFSR
jgi:hypothetical protein